MRLESYSTTGISPCLPRMNDMDVAGLSSLWGAWFMWVSLLLTCVYVCARARKI